MSNKNIFVFAVCGEDRWLNQLNISLKYLKNFSKNEIIVVTDLSRNVIKISHDNIINIQTPPDFDNIRASFYIKTSLHKVLDMSNNYCYLNSNVIAIRKEVDKIFNHNYGKVTFSPDFCKINEASPYLVNCNCLNDKNNEKKELNDIFNKFKNYKDEGKKLTEVMKAENNLFRKLKIFIIAHFQIKIKRLFFKYYAESKQHKSGDIKFNLFMVFKIKLFNKLNINENWIYDSFNKAWFDENNEIIYCEHLQLSDYIENITNFKYNRKIGEWVNKNNSKIFVEPVCNHLTELIKNEFKISISKTNWQHWNSSVFLFNSRSVDFLDLWHKYTLQVLKNGKFKTSDIASLTAVVWKLNLQNKQKFPTEFQLIANFKANNVQYNGNGEYSINEGKTIISPYFINVGSGFGDKNWDVWYSIEKILP